ncbi:MAG: hypothetical protein JWO51_5203, partial [Rhodospirillales bacterium]|nr:hypothetical protein [Rhodospirillales bacterium]
MPRSTFAPSAHRLLSGGAWAVALLSPGLGFAQAVAPPVSVQLPASIDPNRLSDQFRTPAPSGPAVEFEVPAPPPEATPPANADKVLFP